MYVLYNDLYNVLWKQTTTLEHNHNDTTPSLPHLTYLLFVFAHWYVCFLPDVFFFLKEFCDTDQCLKSPHNVSIVLNRVYGVTVVSFAARLIDTTSALSVLK